MPQPWNRFERDLAHILFCKCQQNSVKTNSFRETYLQSTCISQFLSHTSHTSHSKPISLSHSWVSNTVVPNLGAWHTKVSVRDTLCARSIDFRPFSCIMGATRYCNNQVTEPGGKKRLNNTASTQKKQKTKHSPYQNHTKTSTYSPTY